MLDFLLKIWKDIKMQEEQKRKKLAMLRKKKKLQGSKKKKSKKKSKRPDTEVEARFARVKYDPIFQKMDQKEKKVKIDARFKEALTNNKKFSTAPSTKIDKYGRKVQRSKIDKETKELFYDPTSTLEEGKKDDEPLPFHWSAESSSEEEFEGDLHELLGEQVEEYDFLGEEEKNVEMKSISTKRLAMMNYDWGNITSGDIFITMSSFVPAGGEVVSVKKYLSQFGEEMLKKEIEEGPLAAWKGSEREKVGNEDVDELNQKLNDKSVRYYELNKLKYYYSVIEFDSEKTADFAYNNVNNLEIMNTGVSVDLRAIPEELVIPTAPVETITEKPFKASAFNFFVKARQHTNVEITWEKPETGNKMAHLFEVDDDVLDNRIDFTEIINSDDLATESEGEENEKDIEDIRKRLLGGNHKAVYADFDKSNRNKQDIDVKFLAAFEDEESSSEDENDKNKIVFSRNFKKDERGSEEKDVGEVQKDDFFDGQKEEEQQVGVEQQKSKKMTKKDMFKKRLKEKRKLKVEKEKKRRQEIKNRRMKSNSRADLELLTKRDSSYKEDFNPDFDSRFDRLWKDRNMNVDPTDPNYDETKAQVVFDAKRRRKKLKA